VASADPPFACFLQFFNRPSEQVYTLIEDYYSYGLVCDPATQRRHFESEYPIDETLNERRSFDAPIVYPEVVSERIRRAAASARVYSAVTPRPRAGHRALDRAHLVLRRRSISAVVSRSAASGGFTWFAVVVAIQGRARTSMSTTRSSTDISRRSPHAFTASYAL
jgi:hypothetical protein